MSRGVYLHSPGLASVGTPGHEIHQIRSLPDPVNVGTLGARNNRIDIDNDGLPD